MNIDLDQLKTVIGEGLSYSNLCQRTGLLPKRGNAKDKQLRDLAACCQMTVTQHPTRYTINEVYPEAIQAFSTLNGNDKFQTMFEAIMYQALLDKHGEPLYLSSLDLLQLFCEVNENFAYACNADNMRTMGDDYFYMSDMGLTIYRILKRWTLDRLDRMYDRHIINIARGYRVYKEYTGEFGVYKKSLNAPFNSELAQRCAKVCRESEDEWYETTGALRPEEKERRAERLGLPYSKRMPKSFYDGIKALRKKNAKIEFENEGFVDVKVINIISPPEDSWLVDKLQEIYRKYPALESINNEACRKVLATTQLDDLNLSDEQKNKFIELNMRPNPHFYFRQELVKIKRREKEEESAT